MDRQTDEQIYGQKEAIAISPLLFFFKKNVGLMIYLNVMQKSYNVVATFFTFRKFNFIQTQFKPSLKMIIRIVAL